MRLLTISDKVEPVLYSSHIRERVGKVDLVLACGDLPYDYLEFIESSLDAPLCFVHGNHDVPITDRLEQPKLDWAVNLHGRTLQHSGLLLAGLEGCRLYNPGAAYQYTEGQAGWQAFCLGWLLRLNRLRHGRYLDVLVSHAPPFGIHDARDVAHTGFCTYLALLERYHPALMVHGHYHIYDRNAPSDTAYQGVRVVNTFGYRVIELAPRPNGAGWQVLSTRR
jgi:UDP-2,3-diacylglucosamine pyrophosphatase LpxH